MSNGLNKNLNFKWFRITTMRLSRNETYKPTKCHTNTHTQRHLIFKIPRLIPLARLFYYKYLKWTASNAIHPHTIFMTINWKALILTTSSHQSLVSLFTFFGETMIFVYCSKWLFMIEFYANIKLWIGKHLPWEWWRWFYTEIRYKLRYWNALLFRNTSRPT